MAQVSLNDKLRPALQILAKYHFWMLAAIVPFIVVPVLFMAQGSLFKQITAVRDQIKSRLGELESVRKITQHPNPSWSADIDTSTMRVKRETLAEWTRFWNSQEPFRTWPESLGPDFLKAIATLKPDGKLPRKLLERYQNSVRSLVRELPERMGVQNLMMDPNAVGESRPKPGPTSAEPAPPGLPPALFPRDEGQGNQTQASPYVAIWNGGNQSQIYSSFDWPTAPSTMMVMMAQEELRVYGLLCDIIAHMNKPATGPHNAAIPIIEELLIGYLAAEDVTAGATAGRLRGGASGQSAAPGGPAPSGPVEGGAGGKPPHPRFGGDTAALGGQPDAPAAAAGPSDDSLRTWVYVDFNGHPLDAGQLASAPDAKMVHLMPFVMKLVMDQRQIDALLVELATAQLPIDVRQVRINAAGVVSGPMPNQPPDGMSAGPSGSPPAGARLYDVPVEIHGTIGLATQPSEQAVGLEPGQGVEQQPAADGEKPAAAPKAARAASGKRSIPT